MKVYLLAFFCFATNAAFASKKSPASTPGQAASFYYIEVYPKEPLNLTFGSDACEAQHIRVKSFQSIATYPSVDTESRQSVRVVQIYADVPPPCASMSKKGATKADIIEPDLTKMTHVYVTTSGEVSLK